MVSKEARDASSLPEVQESEVEQMNTTKLAPEVRNQIGQQYQEGASSSKLAERYKVSSFTILKVLKEQEIPRRASPAILRQYPVNDEAFNQITGASAYWAGFLMADGYIRGNILQVALGQRDKNHLVKLRAFLNTEERPIYEYKVKSHNVVMLKVRSNILVSRLRELGVTEKKSFTAIASYELEFCPAFWHGVIDGDGTITIDKDKDLPMLIFHSGSQALASQYATFLQKRYFTGFTPTISFRITDHTYRVDLSGRHAYQVVKDLYQFSPVSLDRKRKRAENILEHFKSRYYVE